MSERPAANRCVGRLGSAGRSHDQAEVPPLISRQPPVGAAGMAACPAAQSRRAASGLSLMSSSILRAPIHSALHQRPRHRVDHLARNPLRITHCTTVDLSFPPTTPPPPSHPRHPPCSSSNFATSKLRRLAFLCAPPTIRCSPCGGHTAESSLISPRRTATRATDATEHGEQHTSGRGH